MGKEDNERLIEVRIKRDFWTDKGRHRTGTIVSVPVDAAIEGIENGTLERVKK